MSVPSPRALGASFAVLALGACLSTPQPTDDSDAGARVADASTPDAPASDASPPATDALPLSFDAGATRATRIAVGWEHTCAVFDNGGVKCWGNGDFGKLGYAGLFGYGGDSQPNDVGDDETPADAPFIDLGGVAIDVVAGNWHTCALMMGGKVRCWGRNAAGQCGHPYAQNAALENIGDDETPASVGDVMVGGTVEKLAAGDQHTCALLTDQTLRCWGNEENGRLGVPGLAAPVGDNEFPLVLSGIDLGGTATHFEGGSEHTCARLADGTVRCFGRGRHGRLGYSDAFGVAMNGEPVAIGDDETPASAGPVMIGAGALDIRTGPSHTCAILEDRTVRCWGDNEFAKLGQLMVEDVGDDELPSTMPVVQLGADASQIALGLHHTCALRDDMAVVCWGRADSGQLGYGDTLAVGDNETPAQRGPVPVGGDVEQVDTYSDHTCALLTSGAVRCWGLADNGRLGYGNTDIIGDTETPETAGDVPLLP